MIAYGCGLIDSGSDMIDKNLRSVRTINLVRIIVTCTSKSKRINAITFQEYVEYLRSN